MTPDSLNDKNGIVSMDRYYVLIEATGYYEVKSEHVPLYLEKGKQATIGDYIRIIREHYKVDTEISNIAPFMEFKVLNPVPKGLRQFKILRFTKDFTYRAITKI